MYIFELTPDSIYCRAARFVATDRGVVFNQNFRQGFEAYMIRITGKPPCRCLLMKACFRPKPVCGTAEAYTGPCLIIRKKKLYCTAVREMCITGKSRNVHNMCYFVPKRGNREEIR